MHEDLTVRENLSYSAKLRCMATEGRAYLSDVVDDVIELLGLRHVQHSVVGSVEKRGVRQGPYLFHAKKKSFWAASACCVLT